MPTGYFIFTLVVIGVLSILRNTIKGKPAILMTIVFAIGQVVVAFPVQMVSGKFSWETQLSSDLIQQAFTVLIVFFVTFFGTHTIVSFYEGGTFGGKSVGGSSERNSYVWMFGATFLTLVVFIVIYGQFLFHPRNERNELVSDVTQLAFMHAVQFFGVLCSLGTFEACKHVGFGKHRVKIAAILAIVAGALLVNPIAFPRNYFLSFVLSVVLLRFRTVTKAPVISVVSVVVAFLFIPPLLKGIQTSGLTCLGLDCIPGAGDFDAFTVIAVAAEYAADFGHRGFDVMLALLGFFIPRAIWSGKPLGSNDLIFSHLGYSYTNVSFPVPAEGLFAGGLFGVAISAIIFYGYCWLGDRFYRRPGVGERALGAFLCSSIYMTVRGPVTGILPPLLYGITGFAVLLMIPRILRHFGKRPSTGTPGAVWERGAANLYAEPPVRAAIRPSKGGLLGLAVLAASAIGLLYTPARAAETMPQLPQPDAAAWTQIRQTAERYVAQESPETVWPFERAASGPAPEGRGVFPHYFVPFPLSFENDPPDRDYYARNYLSRAGEHNKFFRQGGYLRERPLPVGPWKSPYWRQINAAIDIQRARLMGADGFGVDLLNLNPGVHRNWQRMMFDVAAAVAPDFRLVPEPDMSTLRSTSRQDIENELIALWHHPASYHLPDGRMLIVPFDAEQRPPGFWKDLIDDMAAHGAPVAFLPDFLNPASAPLYAGLSYGMTVWGDRDLSAIEKGILARTAQIIRMLTRVWMAPVVPQDVRPKNSNFFEVRNSDLFRSLWKAALDQKANYVHLITWNDYSEGTEIAPSSGTQFVFYDLSAYYASWFKSGKEPRITKDAIYYLHRRQIYEPGRVFRPGDIPMKLRGETPVSNDVEMIAFLLSPATLEIEQGGRRYDLDVPAGLQVFRVPAQVGRPVFRIRRGGTVVLEKQSDWDIAAHSEAEDPLYVGGSTIRPFSRLS